MENNHPAFEESFDEVLIQVDLFAHSGTDEHQTTVKNRPAFEESFDEVLIQVDLFTHSGTDKHQATVKSI
ncbi:unnamed protein product [Rotaria sordida]|uniref:Uncharacterized protein n=1 Tax=Rotaria sordida TaxID=392033 RepID=A0A814AKC9_9BILA|nr:unnamed protein product [Rotaria sordida]